MWAVGVWRRGGAGRVVYTALEIAIVPAIPLTMAAGALFGVGPGLVVVSLASTAAAALAFLIARYAARDKVSCTPGAGAADAAGADAAGATIQMVEEGVVWLVRLRHAFRAGNRTGQGQQEVRGNRQSYWQRQLQGAAQPASVRFVPIPCAGRPGRGSKLGGRAQVVLLLRLSPLLPLALSNYLYGLTSVDFVPYVLGSWLGQLPGTFAYVSAGVSVGDLRLCASAPHSEMRMNVPAAQGMHLTPLSWGYIRLRIKYGERVHCRCGCARSRAVLQTRAVHDRA